MLERKLKDLNLNGIHIVSLAVDLVIATNDTRMLRQLKHELSKKQMKDLSKLSHCLGIEFKQSEGKTEFTMG